ncbi:Rpr2-domain-containing protein [Pluteus cervinus]|uniref:Rpr2-domain-containing protein n=1 Tax=Pluteus cervinus TaxID=181527 RepID=A0ACD3AMQ9_9AGAR|nr:Rpr2-domain-containing protein [Pluteus cervinus]
MAKKGKDEAPTPQSATNRDIMQRLNYLYQASVYLSNISPPSTPTSVAQEDASHKPRKKRVTTKDLAKSYVSTMRTAGLKTTVKMDPGVKRTLCQGCNIVMIPGSTVRIRVKSSSSHGHRITYTCTECQKSRCIPAPPHIDSSSIRETDFGDKIVVDEVSTPARSSLPKHRPHKRKPKPCQLPLFAQSVGHVTFRGNERLPDCENSDNGIFIT